MANQLRNHAISCLGIKLFFVVFSNSYAKYTATHHVQLVTESVSEYPVVYVIYKAEFQRRFKLQDYKSTQSVFYSFIFIVKLNMMYNIYV